MRTSSKLIACLVGCALGFVVVSATAQSAVEGAAKVIRLAGSARYSTGNFVWHPLKVGTVLKPGTTIQTSADAQSRVDLVLGDGNVPVPRPMTYRPAIPNSMAPSTVSFRSTAEQNVIRIWGDSILGLDKLTSLQTGADVVTETQLDLKRGRLTGNVKKLSAASKYEVKLPNGVAGVRGTLFDIQAVGIVKVYIGSVIVAWVDPRTQNVTTQTVGGGQSYDASNNQVSLLSMDSLSELEQLSLSLMAPQTLANVTTLANDRTAIGMSPVGANPSSIPGPVSQQGTMGGGGVGGDILIGPPPVLLGK